jgi:hypothetical protein
MAISLLEIINKPSISIGKWIGVMRALIQSQFYIICPFVMASYYMLKGIVQKLLKYSIKLSSILDALNLISISLLFKTRIF